MKKLMLMSTALCLSQLSAFAETNALIEVHFFKNWIIEGERNFGNFNLAIKNTGTTPILIAKDAGYFQIGQLAARPLPRDSQRDSRQEEEYQIMGGEGECFPLLPEETHVYEGRKFFLPNHPFPQGTPFTVSVYLGKGVWLDSEPLTINGVKPDAVEHVAMIKEYPKDIQAPSRELAAVTYKNERWLYVRSPSGSGGFSVCPLSLTNKIRVESYDDALLFKIWDGDKSMVFHMNKMMLTEGSDENDVFGKWTRERKQKAEADNAEVRRKKAEVQTP